MEQNTTPSSVLKQLIDELKQREWIGVYKYGTTVDREDYHFRDWAEELQQELMDALMYLGAMKRKKMYIVTKNNHVEYVVEQYQNALELARKLAIDEKSVRITPVFFVNGIIEPSVNINKDDSAQNESPVQ